MKRCLLCIGVTVVCYNRSCCEVMFVGIGVVVVCYNRSYCEGMFVGIGVTVVCVITGLVMK